MTPRLQRLHDALKQAFGERIVALTEQHRELTLQVRAEDYLAVARALRDRPELRFEQLMDLCGMDYSTYAGGAQNHDAGGGRFAAVSQLMSVTHNWRLRLRCFVADDEFPVLPSLVEVWPSVNWYEREAFDLFGIVFDGHPDLRRILTDYGFIGHPFRKDFPISGYVEMRSDPEQKRVIYQPVTIEPREVTPRVVREEHYGEGRG
jgi:NADH-quinone oxidoreductase subunit C